MISWSNELFLGDNISETDVEKIKQEIMSINNSSNSSSTTTVATITRIHCISFATNSKNLFDIYRLNQLANPYVKKQDIYIVGLSKGKKNAFELVASMLEEVYEKTGDFKVREYFS